MLRRRRAIAVVILALALATSAVWAKGPKAKSDIPARPEQLRFAALTFEVPDAGRHRHTLSNGIPVFVVEDHNLPLVEVSLSLRAGSFLDPADKPGLASMTGTMLRRGGTASLSAEAFDEKVDFLAANMSSSTGDTSGGASFNCISGVLDETLGLFFEMLKAPGFDAERLKVEKQNQLEAMKQRNDNPAAISGREWQWLLRGTDHFTTRLMTAAELDRLTRDDLVAFHRRYWRPENMLVAVSGDVKPEEILAKLERHFSGWKVEGPAVPWPPPPPRHVPKPGVYHVEKEIPQGRVLIGHLGTQQAGWDDPEPFALLVLNDILGGGGFTSRLVKRIRSDEGLAYSTSSAFGVGYYWPGLFQVSYQSKSATVALAAKIALEEIERMRAAPVSEAELQGSKSSFIDAFPRRFESAAQIANTFVGDLYDGRPHEYWKTYRDRVRAVTAKDVQEAARKYLRPDELLYLIVGKWEEIRPGDPDGRASMAELGGGQSTELPLRDPLTLEPLGR